jgi:RNA polymerase sigma factor (sigma-70 family)
MDDALLVSRAMAGDLDSFGQLYDRYFTRIYDFAWRILRDADEAADVTQDVFMKAMQGLGGLGKASSFKSWLFTIAHNTAVTRAERAGRTVPLPAPSHEEGFGAFDVPDPCRLDDPEVVAGDHELASLVWEAATALNPRDYALLDLHVRQGLESAEIAGVMGVSKGNAYTMVSRMKTAAADVIGSYVVARRGSQDCEGLQAVLAEHEFPPYTEPVRRAVDAHIKDCETCSGARKRLVAPLEIFGAFAVVPAPMALKGGIWGDVAGSWYTDGPGGSGGGGTTREPFARNPYGTPEGIGAGAGAVAAGAAGGAGAANAFGFGSGGGGGGGFDSSVAPMSYGGGDEGWNRNRILLFAGAALGLLIFAFAGGALYAGRNDGRGGRGQPSTQNTTASRT